MNSTSARESGGNLAFVDGGKVFVGWPGAPGCTTTGPEESPCCEVAGKEKKTIDAVAASKMPQNRANFLADWTSRRCSLIRLGWGIASKLKPAY
jgi:hypothetical protein